jgi:hypothetical protein
MVAGPGIHVGYRESSKVKNMSKKTQNDVLLKLLGNQWIKIQIRIHMDPLAFDRLGPGPDPDPSGQNDPQKR